MGLVPHALCGLVLVIAVELRRSQHGLAEDGQEAQGLHEQHRVEEEVGDVGRHQREGHHALHVVGKVTPRPEVAPVKVWKSAQQGGGGPVSSQEWTGEESHSGTAGKH